MNPCYARLAMVIGSEAVERLNRCSVAVVGIGGVGGICAEALARSGVGRLVLVDGDSVEETNINRQVVAFSTTVGQNKALLMAGQLMEMNPELTIESYPVFFTKDEFPLEGLDYVVDAIDSTDDKVQLIKKCRELGIPILSAMGAGNKLDPMAFQVMMIENTIIDPFAKVMRKKLKEQGIAGVKVICSTEKPIKTGCATPGSFMPVVAAAGLLIAAEVIKDLIARDNQQ
jgi:tRNA A37 threonylcarbamoyladenosine dehydratase